MPADSSPLHLAIKRVRQSWSSLLLILSFVCLISGFVGILFVQNQDPSFDTRQQASTNKEVGEEKGEIRYELTSPQANTSIKTNDGEFSTIDFELNESTDARMISILLHIKGDGLEDIELNVLPGAKVNSNEIQQTRDGYLVEAEFNLPDIKPTRNLQIFNLKFKARQSEELFFSFDQDRTTVYYDDENRYPLFANSFALEIVNNDETSEIPAITPTPSPSARPTPSPAGEPSARPTPSPDNRTSVPTIRACNDACSSNAQCAANHLCYDTGNGRRCRLASNPSSSSCSTQSSNRDGTIACNQICNSNSECRTGLTCWSNRCRRPDNIESSSCSAPSSTVTQAVIKSCNQSCSSNRECAINMRCYNSTCRLASNPSSSSCSAVTEPTITDNYQGKGGTDATKSADATMSAQISPAPSFRPIASPMSTTVETNLQPTAETDRGLLAQFRQYFTQNSRQLMMILLGVGLLLLVILLIATLLKKLRRPKPPTPPIAPSGLQQKVNSPQPVTSSSPTPVSPPTQLRQAPVEQTSNATEEALQARINELMNETAPAAAPPRAENPAIQENHTASTPNSTQKSSMIQRISEKNLKLGN